MVPAVVLDRTENWDWPFWVFCGEAVSNVVLALLVVLLKLTEIPLAGERLLFASTVLTVATETDEPSFLMYAGWNWHARVCGPSGVNVMFAEAEETLESPELNVTVHVVAKVDLKMKRARLDVPPSVNDPGCKPEAPVEIVTVPVEPSAFVPEQLLPSVAEIFSVEAVLTVAVVIGLPLAS